MSYLTESWIQKFKENNLYNNFILEIVLFAVLKLMLELKYGAVNSVISLFI